MDLDKTRDEINQINAEMLKLFERRMKCAFDVAEYKKENNMEIYDAGREKKILSHIESLASEEYKTYAIDFFQNIMDISKEYQERLLKPFSTESINPVILESIKPNSVAYQGIEGSYSHEACESAFPDADKIGVKTFNDVFKLVESGDADYGILPVENSSTGSLFEIYELLLKYKFYIVAEKILKIDHNLLSIHGAKTENLTTIYSHPQAFMQSSDFLSTLKDVELLPYYNTAISAQAISEYNDKTKGAIASKKAAKLYNLNILAESINNKKDNYTRFIVVSPDLKITKNASKVSVTFIVKHQSGALMKCLKSFSKKNLNLIKLESRPHPEKAWQYVFFADFEGNFVNGDISEIISDLKKETLSFDFLGNY